MKFKLYYQKQPTAGAPDIVSLEDYELAGEVESESRNMVVARSEMRARATAQLADLTPETTESDEKFEYKRPITIGDLIVDEQEVAWIFTPMWVWAQVIVVSA